MARLRMHQVDGSVVGGLIFMHAGCLLAPAYVTPGAVAVFVAGIWLFGGLGVCLGFHRLLTHRSFRAPRWLERTLAVLGCLAWQGSPVQWAAVHRMHHRDSDGPTDPHSPRAGFWWAHMIWILQKRPIDRPVEEVAGDLLRDPVLRWLHRWFWTLQLPLAAGLYAAGGLPWVVWGIFVRTTIVWHGTWLINSACHRWGYANFDLEDDSRNLWWVALLTFGEGWHNNHHRHAAAADHGLRGWEVDLTFATIRLLERLGWVDRVVAHRSRAELAAGSAQQVADGVPLER